MSLIPNVIYTAAFISKQEREKILSMFPVKHGNVFADHMTIKYNPSEEDMLDFKVGDKVTLSVVGIAEDENGQALVISDETSPTGRSHITLSTSGDTPPVYSNELIEKKGFKELKDHVQIEATKGFFDGKTPITEAHEVSIIVLPTRSQPDTIIAIFILKSFGTFRFPGIEKARYEFWPKLPEGETEDSLLKKGTLLLDVGGGSLDHHVSTEKTTASKLVAQKLNVDGYQSLTKLLQFAERDDFFGKGIISTDALDRAFGLSGLVVNLNKKYSGDPSKVIDIILPLIDAHFEEEEKRTKEMPLEVEKKFASGEAEAFSARQKGKNLRCIFIESDNVSLAGFLRSQLGGRYDVVVQKMQTGHTNFLTRPTKRVDLRYLAATIRRAELMRSGNAKLLSMVILTKEGKVDDVPQWYFDPATNSLQNGGINTSQVRATKLSRNEVIKLAQLGLES